MNYSQTLEFLYAAMPSFQRQGAGAYKPGLERITEFCRIMGNPQRNYFVIHVAGTDGKGSVSSMLASVLQSAGYRTGLFTSPHLRDFRERIRVDGEVISKQKVVNFVDKYREAMLECSLSFFEMTAAMAFDFFSQSDVEVAVIETGLGGRLDATNIVTPVLSIITNVGLEHTDLLGDTLPAIAAEKAGIIKKSIPLIVGERNDDTDAVFERRAAELKSKVVYAEESFRLHQHEPLPDGNRFRLERLRDGYMYNITIDIAGECQRCNIVTACAAADFLHEETPLTISRRALLDGLRHVAAYTGLCGRWQTVEDAPLTVCDTGHTPYAFAYIASQINSMQCAGKKIAVLGFSNDKKIDEIFAQLEKADGIDELVLTHADISRAADTAQLQACAERHGFVCSTADNIVEAVKAARAKAGADGFVFVGGSNYIIAEYLETIPTQEK